MRKKKWSKKKIIQELKQIANEMHRTPRVVDLARKGRWDLVRASQRFFGTYVNAVKRARLKPNKIYWSKELIIKELRRLYKQFGHTPTYRELRKIRLDLQAAIERHFKKYNNAVTAANLPLNNIRWSKNKIIKQLKNLAKRLGHTPTERELRRMNLCDLFGAIQRHFKSYNRAMESAGLNPNEPFYDNFWKEWEKFVIKIVKKLYKNEEIMIHQRLENNTRPDIILKSSNKIIEIKLNICTETVENGIKNYLEYCNNLEFWYLRGRKPELVSEKIKFVNPKEIEKLILEINDKILFRRFLLFKKGITPNNQYFIDRYGGIFNVRC